MLALSSSRIVRSAVENLSLVMWRTTSEGGGGGGVEVGFVWGVKPLGQRDWDWAEEEEEEEGTNETGRRVCPIDGWTDADEMGTPLEKVSAV
jgi:hypothetical protein